MRAGSGVARSIRFCNGSSKYNAVMSAYLNGEFVPLEQACVPVLDRGFLFGDGVYEVIPVYGGRLFRLAHHLQRLDRSLREVRIVNPHSEPQWRAIFERLIAPADAALDWSLYLQVTRGVAQRDHAFPADVPPTVFAMLNAIAAPSPTLLAQGIKAITREDIRWGRCDIKAIALLANVLMRQEAVEAGAMEAILLRDGLASEGAASNLFIVSEGVIITPPKSAQLLPGVTRDLILELAAKAGLAWREAAISRQDLEQAEEIWLSSSTREILPVTALDARVVGHGRPGPLWQRMQGLYQEYKAGLRAGAPDTA